MCFGPLRYLTFHMPGFAEQTLWGKVAFLLASSCGSSPRTNRLPMRCMSDSVHVAVHVILPFLMLIGRRRETTQPNLRED